MANELTVTSKSELVAKVGRKLEEMLAEQAKALPKEFNQTRFLQNCLTVMADTKDIEKCKPLSIVRTMIKGAYLGLDFFRRECYAIPYGDMLTFQTDYKGEVKLAKKYGNNILDVYSKLVQEGDELEIGVVDGKQVINFRPKPFNDGKILGAIAVVLFKDGTTRYETMSIQEIEDVRKSYSKAPNSPAWTKSYGEMCKKVPLRRLCKGIDLDFDTQEQRIAYEEAGDVEFKHAKIEKEAPKVADPFADKPADAQSQAPAEAEIIDPDAKMRAELKKKYPNEEPWQIAARIKEIKEAETY